METRLEKLTLENLNGGAVGEMFAEEWERVVADIADSNKPADKPRTITIEIRVEPEEGRSYAAVLIKTKTKLPAAIGTAGIAYFSLESGHVETYVTDPNQAELSESMADKIVKLSGGQDE